MNLVNLAKFPKKSKIFFSPCGSRKKPVYKYVYDEKYGCPRRVLNGYIDFEDYIQEARDGVDFKSLGKMLVEHKANIIDHFVSKDGQVIDITGTPRNIHEASKLYNDLRESFDSLPIELKNLFDGSFESFRQSYRAGTMASKIESFYKSLEDSSTQTQVIKKEGDSE